MQSGQKKESELDCESENPWYFLNEKNSFEIGWHCGFFFRIHLESMGFAIYYTLLGC